MASKVTAELKTYEAAARSIDETLEKMGLDYLDQMAANAAVDFTISEENMEALKHMDRIADYGDFNIFPVFSGKPLA